MGDKQFPITFVHMLIYAKIKLTFLSSKSGKKWKKKINKKFLKFL